MDDNRTDTDIHEAIIEEQPKKGTKEDKLLLILAVFSYYQILQLGQCLPWAVLVNKPDIYQ